MESGLLQKMEYKAETKMFGGASLQQSKQQMMMLKQQNVVEGAQPQTGENAALENTINRQAEEISNLNEKVKNLLLNEQKLEFWNSAKSERVPEKVAKEETNEQQKALEEEMQNYKVQINQLQANIE